MPLSAERKFFSLKYQILIFVGFVILFGGLFLHFYSDIMLSLRAFTSIYIIADCLGVLLILLSISLVIFTNKATIKETWRTLFIESSLTFSFSLSLIATLFHIIFHDTPLPVSLGLNFIFVSYMLVIFSLVMSVDQSLFGNYYGLFVSVIVIIILGAVTSGVFLTFTGSRDEIVDSGIGVLSLGAVSLLALIIGLLFFTKRKLLSHDEDDEFVEGDEEDENEYEEDYDEEVLEDDK